MPPTTRQPAQTGDAVRAPFVTTADDSTPTTRETVETFFERLASGDPDRIAELFADPVDWFIPGNEALAPWLGRRGSRAAVADFFRLLLASVEPLRAEVQLVLVDGEAAIATGEFASRMLATGKVVESIFFTRFTVREGQITHYRLLEDSYAVVVALTPDEEQADQVNANRS